ncbi:biotin--protein ligase [Ochlerotatus camptorhynchus]|uniref:biotin--protein ligase n=1 Tax=Ochlerotatus camptorhynchus TaxID=644619 RepID=UPI0031CE521A
MFYCMTKGARSLVSLNNLRDKLFQRQLETFSSRFGLQIVPTVVGQIRFFSMSSKPPNILVYSKNASVKNCLIESLRSTLEADTYTIYPIVDGQVEAQAWPESTALLLIHGTLDRSVAEVFLNYFINGGKLLGLCSGLVEVILPNLVKNERLGTENVSLNYDRWQNVTIAQEILQWQPIGNEAKLSEIVKNMAGMEHKLDVEILTRERTLNTPSIFSVKSLSSGGEGIFTQLILTEHEGLAQDVLMHLLSSCLKIKTKEQVTTHAVISYKNAFLLGSVDRKRKFLDLLNDTNRIRNVLNLGELSLQFCSKTKKLSTPSESQLPVLTDRAPEDFSTDAYLSHLKTSLLGRIAIYCPVITSSMVIVSNATLTHGFVAIPRRQSRGSGRNNNQWLSPEGCAMFSLQLHVPLGSPLGQRLPLIQQLVAVAVVNAIRSMAGYEKLDIGVKWPNDIYAKGSTKIGGLIINSQLCSSEAIVNVGCGVNLSNSSPTVCINDLIREYNKGSGMKLPLLGYEQTLAVIFNEIEKLFNEIQSGDELQPLYDLYYKYWLHGGKCVVIKGDNGTEMTGTVVGIDEYGYLLVKTDQNPKPICVHPDGNSFDMMKGLIIPKYF